MCATLASVGGGGAWQNDFQILQKVIKGVRQVTTQKPNLTLSSPRGTPKSASSWCPGHAHRRIKQFSTELSNYLLQILVLPLQQSFSTFNCTFMVTNISWFFRLKEQKTVLSPPPHQHQFKLQFVCFYFLFN